MTPADILQSLAERGAGAGLELHADRIDPTVRVPPGRLLEVATVLRDSPELGMDFLRCLTGVDDGDAMRVLLHLYSYQHRHGLVLEVPLDRAAPRVASVQGLWPTADWFEREAWDLLGIEFVGHPRLERLLMPEDWQGHPLRKDYTRPDGYHGIVTTRDGVVPLTRKPAGQGPVVAPAQHQRKAEELAGFMRLNMGPHHPATHGVINFILETDGEILRRAIPDVGYLHRGIEKLAESNVYIGTMPYTDRVDYLSAMTSNHAYALTVERLIEAPVPPRGEYCRVIADELNRIASHLIATGAIAMDLGAYTPFMLWIQERETINDLMEQICGARLTFNYFRFGGVARDIAGETLDRILRWLDHFEPMIDEFDRLISGNEIFVQRLANVAVISAQEAVGYGLVGPNLRGSGVDFDLRRDQPYSVYPELDFDVVVGRGFRGQVGDSYDRFVCRVLEIRQSARLLRQACEKIPAGEVWEKPKAVKPAANEAYGAVESARGELGVYIASNGTDKPHRVHFRTGSFTAMSIIEHLSPGLMIADLVALIGALDVVAPEVDR
jgi:NADH-quinone oxidoreductase subunit D